MISRIPWQWIAESEQLAADLVDPPRQLTIRWDEADRGWFLSVVVVARPATMGRSATEPRVYVAPLPLLAAMTMVPRELHDHLIGRVGSEADAMQARVFAELAVAAEQLPQSWPGPGKAKLSLNTAEAHAGELERLSLDLAGAGAWDE